MLPQNSHGNAFVIMTDRPLRDWFDRTPPNGFVSNFARYKFCRSSLSEALFAVLPEVGIDELSDYLKDVPKLVPRHWLKELPDADWENGISPKQLKKLPHEPLRVDKQLGLFLAGLQLVQEKGGNEQQFKDGFRLYLAIYAIAGFTRKMWDDLESEHGEILRETKQRNVGVMEQMSKDAPVPVTYPTALRVQEALRKRKAQVGHIYPMEDRPSGRNAKKPCLLEIFVLPTA